MNAEKRRFGMHQNLLYDVILRQAGTLQKAVLEGVMNAIDAGATECRVTMDTHRFSISDNGHGFQSRREIEDFFEMFGTPHEKGDAIYGRFRMGRGQMMAFGANVWRSRTFEMHVDIKKEGLDYSLFEKEEDHQGTRIEVDLYDPIVPSDLERMKAELRRFVAWAQIPVFLNDEQISKTPSEGKWDHEDEHAYYALSDNRSQLEIYNLGVLVTSAWAGRFGMGGTVVSKQQLEVNFARNDVQSTCPSFKAITAYIKKRAEIGTEKKTKLTDAERAMLVESFLAGTIEIDKVAKLRCITDVNGRSWPLSKLEQIGHKFSNRLTVAQRGDMVIETAQRRGITFSVDETTLERFGASDGQGFLNRVAQSLRLIVENNKPAAQQYSRSYYDVKRLCDIVESEIDIADRDLLSQFVSDDYIALEEKEMTADLKAMLFAIENGYAAMLTAMNLAQYEDRRFERRRIRLGKSDTAYAWTDGKHTIWVNIEHARLLRRGTPGAYQIASTLLHEMLHEGPDTGTHQHDFDFYQAFHDLSGVDQDPVGTAAERMVTIFINRLKKDKKRISKKLLARDDQDIMIDSIREEIEAQA